MTFLRREDVETLVRPFDVITMDEREEDAPTARQENKHWHIFFIIVRKQ